MRHPRTTGPLCGSPITICCPIASGAWLLLLLLLLLLPVSLSAQPSLSCEVWPGRRASTTLAMLLIAGPWGDACGGVGRVWGVEEAH